MGICVAACACVLSSRACECETTTQVKQAVDAAVNGRPGDLQSRTSESVDSELRCSICLGTFVCPSTLSCGHSFCLRCLEAAWETASSFSCPQCRATFPVRPQLRRNVTLANLAEQLRVGDGMATAVMCDICGDGQTPAVKTCLRCEMSYCVNHLMRHRENPRLREHVLVAPIANLEERQCREHSRELEFYCTVDSSLVCSTCTIAGKHTGHKVLTLKDEHETRKTRVGKETRAVEEKKKEAEESVKRMEAARKEAQESVAGIRGRITGKFARLRKALNEDEKEALQRVAVKERELLSRIDEDIARHKREIGELQTAAARLRALQHERDSLAFLQGHLAETRRYRSLTSHGERPQRNLHPHLPLHWTPPRSAPLKGPCADSCLSSMDAHRLWTQTQPTTNSRFPRISGRRRGAVSPRVAPITHTALSAGYKPCALRASRRVSTTGRWTWGARVGVGLESRTGRSHGEGVVMSASWEGVTSPGVYRNMTTASQCGMAG
ncbi:E3 ubiquitin-protein ligase TRIM47-like isoform X3 [Lampetra planeri]